MSLTTQLHRGLFGLALIVALSTVGLVAQPVTGLPGAHGRVVSLDTDCDADDCLPALQRIAWRGDAAEGLVVRIAAASVPEQDAGADPVRMQDMLPGIMFRCSTSSCSSRKSRPTRAM